MPARCPVCSSKLSWWSLSGSFACPSCHKPLKARIAGPWVATIVLWSLVEIPLHAAMPAPDGLAGLGLVLVRSLLSFGIGFIIGSVIVGSFGEVSERRVNE